MWVLWVDVVAEFGFEVGEFFGEVCVPREVVEFVVVAVEPCCPEVSDGCGLWDGDVEVFGDVGAQFPESGLGFGEVGELCVVGWAAGSCGVGADAGL